MIYRSVRRIIYCFKNYNHVFEFLYDSMCNFLRFHAAEFGIACLHMLFDRRSSNNLIYRPCEPIRRNQHGALPIVFVSKE